MGFPGELLMITGQKMQHLWSRMDSQSFHEGLSREEKNGFISFSTIWHNTLEENGDRIAGM